jgi:hypothetical protein
VFRYALHPIRRSGRSEFDEADTSVVSTLSHVVLNGRSIAASKSLCNTHRKFRSVVTVAISTGPPHTGGSDVHFITLLVRNGDELAVDDVG